jgi:2-(1,2-epoxy-1,2-dihydrophenyl)acetyl-CoA isomerase
MFETILFEKEEGLAIITLNRPQALNAFDEQMHEEVYQAVNLAAEDADVHCILLTGSGRGFSAGADIKVIKEATGEVDLGEYLRKTYNQLLLKIQEIEKPFVAALHGPVYGAGLGVALACDFRIAAASSKYCMAFINIGLVPDAGTSFFLPRIIGLSRAMEMTMTGEPVDAEEAYRIGLVNKVVVDEELDKEAKAFARRLIQAPTKALGLSKRMLWQSFESDLATALNREAEFQAVCGRSADHKEAITAFFEKRKPNFIGK